MKRQKALAHLHVAQYRLTCSCNLNAVSLAPESRVDREASKDARQRWVSHVIKSMMKAQETKSG
jgi:hypothetical protein